MKTPQYGRSPVQDAMAAIDAIDAVNGSTWNDSPSRARAFSTDRRASLQLREHHDCPRCGESTLRLGWCERCEAERAEWDRIEQAVAGKRPKEAEYTWRGLAVACVLWLAFVLTGCYVLARVVQP